MFFFDSANPFDGINVPSKSMPALGDIDGDGDLDLVVGYTVIWIGDEDSFLYYENVGSTASPIFQAVAGSASPFHMIDDADGAKGSYSTPAFVDIDSDGDLDLVVGQLDGLYYYENVGSVRSPSYEAVTGSASPFDGIGNNGKVMFTFGDIDGDGDLDFVVGKSDGVLNYYENVGDEEAHGNVAPTLVDLDGDGNLGLVVGNMDGTLNYYENVRSAAAPSYVAVTGSASPFDGIEFVGAFSVSALGDLDGDGDLDLVVGEEDGDLYYCERRVGVADLCGECTVIGALISPALVDLDGDGDLDLVVGDRAGTLSYYENVGSAVLPSYEAVTGSASPFFIDGEPIDVGIFSAPALADLDGDGDLDLCTNCGAGFFSSAGASECESCAPGTYSGSGASECEPCATKMYQNKAAQSSCNFADAGFFVDATGASNQTACDAGKYSGSGASECVDCEAGTYQDATGKSSCLLANAGSFVDAIGASEQTACDAGKYSGSGEECKGCEAGTYQDAPGKSTCNNANPVVRRRGGRLEAVKCDAGKYSGSGQSSCSLADAGSYVDDDGASEQDSCPTGKYSGSGASKCTDCDEGTYAEEKGQTSCAGKRGLR
ncbi:DNA-directed 5'-3' RNA polymerase [Aureococcus anophagefferens]|nr:DNA-directed 5'-3' RNA polymerase [Aureococcus anophagefferens]